VCTVHHTRCVAVTAVNRRFVVDVVAA
jgi:hypothetical protein